MPQKVSVSEFQFRHERLIRQKHGRSFIQQLIPFKLSRRRLCSIIFLECLSRFQNDHGAIVYGYRSFVYVITQRYSSLEVIYDKSIKALLCSKYNIFFKHKVISRLYKWCCKKKLTTWCIFKVLRQFIMVDLILKWSHKLYTALKIIRFNDELYGNSHMRRMLP